MTEETSRPPVSRPIQRRPRARSAAGARVAAFLRSLFRIIELSARLIVSLAVLAVVVMLLVWIVPQRGPDVPDSTALVVAPSGYLVEQARGYGFEELLLDLLGQPIDPETSMRPLLEAIDRAKDDDRVKVLVLDLNRMAGGGLSKLQRLKEAIEEFKESGKPVAAFSDFYLQSQYYLASLADEVYVNPMGMVVLPGYGGYRRYYKEALDRIDARWNVFRVGEYKSAVEPYIRNDMSDEAREARREWLSDLWRGYRDDVAAARELDPETLESYASEYHLQLAEHGGDAAQLALETGLVDHVAPRDAVRARLIELAGEEEETGSFNQIGYRSYLSVTEGEDKDADNVVAVVVAKGSILDGRQPAGTIGGDSTAKLIREAREDEDVKAVVLRVDSPGGSAFAAEIIRREVELTREAGKPVVASLGSVAASGGYWISMTSDEIWASGSTITGSIGIYAMIPTFEQSLRKLGIHNDGVVTHPMAGLTGVDRDLPVEVRESLRLMIEEGYEEFITKAAAGRGMEVEEIDRIARGRVWSGEDAHRLGLVDQLGGLDEAVSAAAKLADLGDDYRRRYVEVRPTQRQQLLSWLVTRARPWLGDQRTSRSSGGLENPLLRGLVDDLGVLTDSRRPFELVAYCFCDYR